MVSRPRTAIGLVQFGAGEDGGVAGEEAILEQLDLDLERLSPEDEEVP